MKWMIASDIHGSAYWCEKLLEQYKKEGADRLLLLGDLLYHGPRNDLPREYNPKGVISMLNGMKENITCVRGNCEAEVDQMVLQFPVLAEYGVMMLGEKMLFFTHGHHFNEQNPPMLKKGDILLNGHFHVPACREKEGFVYMNPGSVSIPKENSANSYMTLEDGHFQWKDMDGKAYMEYYLK
ncbi:MAG: phosphodiesterase [Clostridia bacterium]|nr:phosphodiesterase [Clostridia bacterium]